MNNEITRDEMIEILKDTIYHLAIDRSKSSWDDRDYERLGDEDYYDISCEITHYVNELLSKRRTQKLEKIISKMK